MMKIKFTAQVMAIVLLMAIFSDSKAQIMSSFDVDSDGWLVSGDAESLTPEYFTTGGNPGGYISANDRRTGGYWYWAAPAKFMGNHLDAYGKLMQFDLRQSGLNNQSDRDDIIMKGGGLTIVCDLAQNPGLTWTHYDVPLDLTLQWKINTLNGALATETDIKTVLSNITSLRIRGEYIVGADRGDFDNFIFPANVLPIYLLNFSAQTQNAQVLLHWATTNEINSSHFDIEHSINGSNFANIGKINAAINSTSLITYTFNHIKPIKGKNFYRLKMYDSDGSYTYSKIIKVAIEEKNVIEIFPNPVIDKFTISGLPVDGVSKIQISDVTGKVIKTQTASVNTFVINIGQQKPGVYFILISNNNKSQQFKIIKR